MLSAADDGAFGVSGLEAFFGGGGGGDELVGVAFGEGFLGDFGGLGGERGRDIEGIEAQVCRGERDGGWLV